ncbi:peptidoglycan recognition protein-like, partial [Ceratina calcarata]
AHTYRYNKKSIGIAFLGNYQTVNASDAMVNVAHKLILCGKAQGILKEDVRVLGGRQLISSLSPGAKLYDQIRNWQEWSSSP